MFRNGPHTQAWCFICGCQLSCVVTSRGKNPLPPCREVLGIPLSLRSSPPIHPISVPRSLPLRVLDSKFPGHPHGHEFHPLKVRLRLSRTLSNLPDSGQNWAPVPGRVLSRPCSRRTSCGRRTSAARRRVCEGTWRRRASSMKSNPN